MPDLCLGVVEEHHVGYRAAAVVEGEEDDAFAAAHRGGAADPGDEHFGAAGQVHEV